MHASWIFEPCLDCRPLLVLRLLFALSFCFTSVLTLPAIDPKIDKKLQTASETTVIISFVSNDVEKILDPYVTGRSGKTFTNRGARLTALQKELTDHANQLHEVTLQVIKGIQRPGGQKPYDLLQLQCNGNLKVRNADKALIQELSKSHEIESITQEEDRKLDISPPDEEKIKTENVQRQSGDSWGVKSMGFHKIWSTGNRGKGVVVGVIDTGVDPNHEALKDNFRSQHGWYEPRFFTKHPYDPRNHGTGVASIVVGNKRDIGCAPEAKWIACLAVQVESKDEVSDLDECISFMMCPTDTDGKNPKCELAPRVVVASVSYPLLPGFTYHDRCLKALKAAQIPIIFAIGNTGRKCGTAEAPGDSEFVIGVGATKADLTVETYSSYGPPASLAHKSNRIKPDVVAPGSNILVAVAGRPSGYSASAGTSLAAPHVAGLAALYFHDFPNATGDQFKELLLSSAKPILKPNGLNLTCGGIPESQYPNNIAGYGLVDASFFMDKAHGRKSTANSLQPDSKLKMLLAVVVMGILRTYWFELANSML